MTLTKKELMTAVKLCSDVAVQRGLPNMRIRPKSHVHYNVRTPFHAHHRKPRPSNDGMPNNMAINVANPSTPMANGPVHSKCKISIMIVDTIIIIVEALNENTIYKLLVRRSLYILFFCS